MLLEGPSTAQKKGQTGTLCSTEDRLKVSYEQFTQDLNNFGRECQFQIATFLIDCSNNQKKRKKEFCIFSVIVLPHQNKDCIYQSIYQVMFMYLIHFTFCQWACKLYINKIKIVCSIFESDLICILIELQQLSELKSIKCLGSIDRNMNTVNKIRSCMEMKKEQKREGKHFFKSLNMHESSTITCLMNCIPCLTIICATHSPNSTILVQYEYCTCTIFYFLVAIHLIVKF